MEADAYVHVREFSRIYETGLLWHCLCAVTRLDIPDLLADGPLAVPELAASVSVYEMPLRRILRFLGDHQIVALEEDHVRLTDRGSVLLKEHPLSMSTPFSSFGAPDVAHGLLHALRTGRPAVEAVTGMSLWEYMAARPADQDAFDRLMHRQAKSIIDACVTHLAWPASGTVADIGGGIGAMLAAALNTSPGLHGILVEQPHLMERAAAFLDEQKVADRCELRAEDLFTPVPQADVYILSFVLHDWDDGNVARILAAVGAHAHPASTLRVFERILPQDGSPHEGRHFDIGMLLLSQGRERTLAEYQQLLNHAGWSVENVIPAYRAVSLIESRRMA